MSKNTPKSTKPRKLKKHGPQPIKNHEITAKITPCFKQAKLTPDTKEKITVLKTSGKFIKTTTIIKILYYLCTKKMISNEYYFE